MNLSARLLLIGAAASLLGTSPALAAPDLYRLRFKVVRENRPPVEPELVVAAEREGAIEVGSSRDPGEGYRLEATAKPIPHPHGRPGNWLQVSVQFHERDGDGWKLRAKPWLLVPLRESRAAPAGEAPAAFTLRSRAGRATFELSLFASAVSQAELEAMKARGAAPR